jgi:hypothetical protein
MSGGRVGWSIGRGRWVSLFNCKTLHEELRRVLWGLGLCSELLGWGLDFFWKRYDLV